MSLVLVVEDNPANMELITTVLDEEGYELITATDGASGLSLAYNRMPDIVLMDVSLPLLNGLDATRILKREAQTQDIPIIALTAHAMRGDREECLAAGCNDYETKPINAGRIMEKMEALMRARAPEFVKMVERSRRERGVASVDGGNALQKANERVTELESLITKAALESNEEYTRRLNEVEAQHAAELEQAERAHSTAVSALQEQLKQARSAPTPGLQAQTAAEVEKVIDEMLESHNEEIVGLENEHQQAVAELNEQLQAVQAKLETAQKAASTVKRTQSRTRKLAAEKRLDEALKRQQVLEEVNATLQSQLDDMRSAHAAMPVDTRILQAEVERRDGELARARSALVNLQHAVRSAVDQSFHDAMYGATRGAEAAK